MARIRPDGGVHGSVVTPSNSSAVGIWSLKDLERSVRNTAWPAPPPTVVADANFEHTTLLLHGDGSNGANNTLFVDSSINAFNLTTNGKPYQGTFSPFSQTGWSNYFDGNGDYLTVAANAALSVGSGDFTVECWVVFNALPSSGAISPFMESQIVAASATSDKFWFGLFNSSGTYRLQMGQHSTGFSSYANWTPSLGRWYHVALSRSSGTVRLFVDGVSQSMTNPTIFSGVSFGQNGFTIGAITTPYYFNGFISNFRFINGTALYTSSFTPSTVPLTAVSGTQLLACKDNIFKDNSTNAFTLTRSGDVSVQPFSPFAPTTSYTKTEVGGSAYFSGSSDYFTFPNSSALAFGTGAFTIEFWINAPLNNDKFILSGRAAVGTMHITTGGYSSTAGVLRYVGSSTIVSSNVITNNQWNHCAIVRDISNNITLYVNGISVGTGTDTTNYSTTSGTWYVSSNDFGAPSNLLTGYISNLRILKGTAQYTTSFTPPTSPLTAISSTSLLLSATNAGVIDHTAKNVLTTGAGANISTAQSKFGNSSISFSGASTGYLQMPSTRFNTIPASTDFTLECWVYAAASSLAPNVWHNVSAQKIIAFYLSDSGFSNLDAILGAFNYTSSNASVVRGTTNVVANTWTHVAFVRSGSTITVYVNGTACGTGTSSYGSLPLQLVGAISTGATTPDFYFFSGYIDDLRLTIGVARYTSNFTPPTTAHSDQ